MRFTQNTKGFTLIELLVVITIIGILAVGGTATYTAQIQKARDSTRMTDLNALRSGVEQYYQDYTEYPDATVAMFTSSGTQSVAAYVPKIPRDSKSGQMCGKGTQANAGACDYIYNVGDDANGIQKGMYRVSTAFENKANVDTKANTDGGKEPNRFELGLELNSTKAPNTCNRTAGASSPATVTTRLLTDADCTGTSGVSGLLIAGGS
ncbi:MAG: prepilin-type N-terminal cleavage/methylation domain-containing protein [Candidatus Gracilibacteria bacterium]|nr:prepilin-type N-terminal cleavage/methylation domain-containing protein [Candidatus Gracilibacteria bacterium]